MKRKWSLLVLTRACLAALAAVLFLSCSGESSAPPTPPTPPPFQPQTVVVQLGTQGGATTLISTQAGGWTRNGQPFTSGSTVTGENAANYTLTLSGGTWTAAFVAPDPEPLVLGTSGDAVLLQAQEDGSYQLEGEALAAGRVVTADNGNQYRLVLGTDGAWMAEFVPPAPQLVHLGTSGESRQVGRLEDGGYTVNGEALAPGTLITTLNGNRYTLTLGADGMWAAAFVEADPQRLQLGTSGDAPLLIYRQENGTFQLNNEPLLGGRVVESSNGNRYRLSLVIMGAVRTWRAEYIPSPVTIQLGNTGGVVSLTPNEDGTWRRGSTAFSSGDKVTGSNGFEYRLTLGSDGWIVEALPMTVEVPVTGSDAQPIALARLEDGTYLYDGSPVRSGDTVNVGGSTYTLRFADNRWTAQFLRGEVFVQLGTAGDSITLIRNADGTYEHNGRRVRSGSIERSPNTGIRYRLRLSNGVWSASVYVPPTVDPGVDPGVGTPPVVAEDIFDALPAELITNGAFEASATPGDDDYRIQSGVSGRNADGDEIDYSRFGGSGRFEDDTFVESALRAINGILAPIEAQGLADGTDSQRFVAGILIDSNWENVETELDAIFGENQIPFRTDPPQGSDGTDIDEAIDALEDLREDLSDVASFKSAFNTQIGNNDGDRIFNARKRVLALGSSTNTRFGVIATLTDPTSNAVAAAGTASYDRDAFAFSPLSATEADNLPSGGTARYTGRTWAIDSDEVLYSGAIELRASIAIEQVSATISNLLRSDNNANWTHSGKAVRDITLPVINRGEFMANGSFTRTGGDARVVYDEFGGLSFQDEGSSDFAGQFVGGGGDSSPGTAVIGTWKVGTLLNGSFGAEHTGTSAATLPSSISEVNHGSTGIDTDADTLTIAGFSDPFELSSLRSMTRSDPADSNKTATIRLQNTSLTRFGAWTLVDRTNQANPVTTSGIFNYSQLTPTVFGTNSRPLRGIAQYAGRTAAVDSDGDLYNGNYRLNVTWGATGGDAISASISGLSGFTLGGQTVTQIGFQGTFSGTTFTSPASVTVQYTTSSQGEALTGASPAHDGQFLGSGGSDGPYAVVGTWSLTDPGVSGYTINGAFGADLQRAP
ncbi:MAG: hypothetical protein OXC19_25460 [Bryobacterales bacterium]|nr:hypothetical protein [Bryobacterales bacterium]